MSESKQDTVVLTPQEVETFPWEKPGGDPGLDAMAGRFQARFGEEESGGDPAPPRGTDGPAPDDEEDEAPAGEKSDAAAGEPEEEAEDKGDAPPEADDAGEESDEDAEDDGEEGEDSDDAPVTYEVTVNGEKSRITLDEALAGYQRQADYTRKTTALSNERQEVEAQREEYKGKLEVLYGVLEKAKGEEPDWVKLAGELDPKEFQARKAAYEHVQRQQEQVAAEHAKVVERQRKDYEEARTARISEESAKLVAAIPTWKDPKVAEKEQGELTDYAVSLGFAPDQLDMVEDHKVFVMLRKAMLYDRGQATEAEVAKEIKAKTVKPPKGKSLKPGTKKSPGQRSKAAEKRLTDARARLAQTGSIEDAGAVFAQYLQD